MNFGCVCCCVRLVWTREKELRRTYADGDVIEQSLRDLFLLVLNVLVVQVCPDESYSTIDV
jgi:hypothetical protein